MRWLTTSPFKQMLVAWVSLHCCMKASTAPDILRHVSSRPVVKAACRHGSVTSTSAKQPLWRSYKLRTNFGQRGLRINLFTQRWGGLQVRAVRESSMQKSEAKEGSSWVSSGVLLALGGALPGLVLASKWQQVQIQSETCCQLDAQKKAAKLELELIRPSNNDNRSASDRASLALADKQYGSSISKHSSGSSGHNIHYHSHRLSVPGQFVWHSAIW